MPEQRPFRFGVVAHTAGSAEEWMAKARRAEALGYATLLVPDHLGDHLAPVAALMAAAAVTTRLRIGSFVFDNDFRHPVVLAKEAATLDLLSGGRLELGLGAGWKRPEYEQAGIPFESAAVRVERLVEAVGIVKRLLGGEPVTTAGPYYGAIALSGSPTPVQRPHPPILIGGARRRLLSLAAREADIVGLAAVARPDGTRLDVRDTTPEVTDQKVAWIREAAGERMAALELNILVFAVVVADDRAAAAAWLGERFDVAPEGLLTTPHILLGTVDQICDQLLASRTRYGLSYVTVREESLEAFAPVVARLTGS